MVVAADILVLDEAVSFSREADLATGAAAGAGVGVLAVNGGGGGGGAGGGLCGGGGGSGGLGSGGEVLRCASGDRAVGALQGHAGARVIACLGLALPGCCGAARARRVPGRAACALLGHQLCRARLRRPPVPGLTAGAARRAAASLCGPCATWRCSAR